MTQSEEEEEEEGTCKQIILLFFLPLAFQHHLKETHSRTEEGESEGKKNKKVYKTMMILLPKMATRTTRTTKI
jgi:hypothetical protein